MEFTEAISYFTPIDMEQLLAKHEAKEDFILFMGRPTCVFCRRFAPKLAQVAKKQQLLVYYIDSNHFADFEDIQAFRSHYDIKTVPALVVGNSESVKVVCDSSLSPTAIADFILSGAEK